MSMSYSVIKLKIDEETILYMFNLKIHRIFLSIFVLFSLTVYPVPHIFIEVFCEKEVNHASESKLNQSSSLQEKLPVRVKKAIKIVSINPFPLSVPSAGHPSLPFSSSASPISFLIIASTKLLL